MIYICILEVNNLSTLSLLHSRPNMVNSSSTEVNFGEHWSLDMPSLTCLKSHSVGSTVPLNSSVSLGAIHITMFHFLLDHSLEKDPFHYWF